MSSPHPHSHPHQHPHPKQPYNTSGDGWTFLTQLNAPDHTAAGQGRAVPEVRLQEKLDAAKVIRISFRDGDEIADHHAPGPILVLGQSGKVKFTVRGTTKVIEPGSAIQVDAGVTHSLLADDGEAVVTLIVMSAL